MLDRKDKVTGRTTSQREMADRVAYILRAHELDTPTIASVLQPHGITLSLLADPNALAGRLTGAVIDDIADLMMISPLGKNEKIFAAIAFVLSGF